MSSHAWSSTQWNIQKDGSQQRPENRQRRDVCIREGVDAIAPPQEERVIDST